MPAIGLRMRILALLGAVFAVMLCLIAYMAIAFWNDRLAQTRARLDNQARSVAASHNVALTSTRLFVRLALQAHELRQFTDARRCPAMLREWFVQAPELAGVSIARPDGDVVCDATRGAVNGMVNLADRAYFQHALRTRQLVVGEAVMSRGTRLWSLPFAQAIAEDDEPPAGVLVALLDLTKLNRALAQERYPEGARLGLVDGRGVVLTRFPDQEGYTGRNIADSELFRALIANGGSGTAEAMGLDGTRRLFAFARFADTSAGPIYLWLGVAKDAATVDIRRDLLPKLGVALGLLALSFAVAWRLAGRLDKSLRFSELRFRAVADASPDALLILKSVRDKAGKLVDFTLVDINRTAEDRIAGPLGRKPLIGDRVSAIMPELVREPMLSKYLSVIETRVPLESDLAVDRPLPLGRVYRRQVAIPLNDGLALSSHDITKVKVAEEALRESEQRWKFALEGADCGVWDWDRARGVMYVSPRWKSIFGYSDAELESRDEYAFIHPDDVPRMEAEMERAWRGEATFLRTQYRIRHRDGHYLWVVTRAKVVEWDEQGRPTRIAGTTTDITQAKLMELELESSRELFRSLADAIPLGLYRLDREGHILFANEFMRRMILDEGDIIGRSIYTLNDRPYAEMAAARAIDQQVMASGKPTMMVEEHYAAATGTYTYMEITRIPARRADGRIDGIQGVIRDISEQVRANERQRLAAMVFESSLQGIIVMDAQWIILAVNQTFTHISGYELEDVLGKPLSALRQGVDKRYRLPNGMREALAAKFHWEGEIWSRRKNGEMYFQSLTLDALRDESGKITNYIAMNRDISERVKAEQEIRALNAELEQRVEERTRDLQATMKELEAFSYSISHDLRAPLRGIEGFTRILMQKYGQALDATGRDYLDRVRRGAVRMSELIEDLLALSQVTRGSFVAEAVSLSELAQEIAGELMVADAGREVSFDIEEGIVVQADRRLIRIALENLLSNAWKFTGKCAAATIALGTCETPQGRAVFLRDNGAGFDMRHADQMFLPFHRLHTNEDYPGSGIGLAIVQRVMARHGGRIWAESAVGAGTTVYFIV